MLPLRDPFIDRDIEVVGRGTAGLYNVIRIEEPRTHSGAIFISGYISAVPADGWRLAEVTYIVRWSNVTRSWDYDTGGIVESTEQGADFYRASSFDVDSRIGEVDRPGGGAYISSESYEDVVGIRVTFVKEDEPLGKPTLYAVSGGGGNVDPTSQVVDGLPGETVSLNVNAVADVGYAFARWEAHGCTIDDALAPLASVHCTVTETSVSYTVIAFFRKLPTPPPEPGTEYTVTVTGIPQAGGATAGGGTFYYGQLCTLTASRNAGYELMSLVNAEDGITIRPPNPPQCFGKTITHSFVVTKNSSWVANFRACTNMILRGRSGLILRGQAGNVLRDW